jgi:hypothetical protein
MPLDAIRWRVAVSLTRRMNGGEAMGRAAVAEWCGRPAGFLSFVKSNLRAVHGC